MTINLKKMICTCTLGAMLASSVVAFPSDVQAANNNANIIINGATYECDSSASPQNINGRVYVPLRVVSEGLGHEVEWDNTTRTVLINSSVDDIDNTTTSFSSLQIYINGQELAIDTSTGVPYITPSGYTMVPVRIVAENLGANVEWNNATSTVTISTSGSGSSNNGSVEPSDPDVSYPDVTPPDNGNGSGEGNTETPSTSSPQSAEEVTLRGTSYCSLEQMQRYLDKMEVSIQQRAAANGQTFVPFPDNIAYYYYTIGQKYNIRGDVALAQALLETGYFQYGNEVKPWQNNFCGLGAVGHTTTEEEYANSLLTAVNHSKAYLQVGIHGWCYDTVATGVEAHIQHLYSYATTNALPSGCELLDGRFNHGNRGVASNLTDLNGKWAVPGNNYGQNIYNNMLVPMMNS